MLLRHTSQREFSHVADLLDLAKSNEAKLDNKPTVLLLPVILVHFRISKYSMDTGTGAYTYGSQLH